MNETVMVLSTVQALQGTQHTGIPFSRNSARMAAQSGILDMFLLLKWSCMIFGADTLTKKVTVFRQT